MASFRAFIFACWGERFIWTIRNKLFYARCMSTHRHIQVVNCEEKNVSQFCQQITLKAFASYCHLSRTTTTTTAVVKECYICTRTALWYN